MNTNTQYTSSETDLLKEKSPLKLVKSDLKVFNTRYLRSLNLITAVGWSITKDAWLKYCQMLADIESHLLHREELNIYFRYELFNASSASYLFKIIKRFNEAHDAGKVVKIYWSCTTEDENGILESGLDLAEMCEFPFQISNL